MVKQTPDFALEKGRRLKSRKGEYIVSQYLGSGGFGITYLVEQEVKVGNIPQKYKFTLKEFFMSGVCSRNANGTMEYPENQRNNIEECKQDFLNEATRLQKLSHPGIVPVNEVFEYNNTVYYVMQYLGDTSLSSYVRQNGPLSEEEATSVIRKVAEALQFLHANNTNHLDVKPDNIMLLDDMQPVLIDFGLAQHFKKSGVATNKNAGLGTSDGYSPMEQYLGICNFAPTADVYALGATYLYTLTGRQPVKASDMNASYIRRTLPPEVSNQCRECLEHALEQGVSYRTASMAEFIDRLPQAASAQPVISTSGRTTRKIERGSKGNSGSLSDGGLLSKKNLLIGLVGFVLFLGLAFLVFGGKSDKGQNKTKTEVKDTIPTVEKDTLKTVNTTDNKEENSVNTEKETVKEEKKTEPNKQNSGNGKTTSSTGSGNSSNSSSAVSNSSHSGSSYGGSSSVSSGTLNLGYATWNGTIKNGKPNGSGTMTYKSSHDEGDGHIANSGDKIIGTYRNGRLDFGKIYRSSGEVETWNIGE